MNPKHEESLLEFLLVEHHLGISEAIKLEQSGSSRGLKLIRFLSDVDQLCIHPPVLESDMEEKSCLRTHDLNCLNHFKFDIAVDSIQRDQQESSSSAVEREEENLGWEVRLKQEIDRICAESDQVFN